VVFPSTESTAAALTFTSPIFPSTARSTITGAEISTASIVPDASILIFPPSYYNIFMVNIPYSQ